MRQDLESRSHISSLQRPMIRSCHKHGLIIESYHHMSVKCNLLPQRQLLEGANDPSLSAEDDRSAVMDHAKDFLQTGFGRSQQTVLCHPHSPRTTLCLLGPALSIEE